MQPISTQLGHAEVLGLVLACDPLGLCDELVRERECCICIWGPWLCLLLVRGDSLGEEFSEMTRGCAEIDSSGSGGKEIVELRFDIGLERGWRSQKFGKWGLLERPREGRRDGERCEGCNSRRATNLYASEWRDVKPEMDEPSST